MICFVNCEELSGAVNPFVIEKYLVEHGWTQFKTKRNDISIFQYTKGDRFEQVTIPLDQTLIDYSWALYDTVKTIANVEGRTIEQVLLTFFAPNFCMGERGPCNCGQGVLKN